MTADLHSYTDHPLDVNGRMDVRVDEGTTGQPHIPLPCVVVIHCVRQLGHPQVTAAQDAVCTTVSLIQRGW